ncbi:response regulator [Thalassobellus citreus]|uniref:response regulator n=1 Tax=Thalassobellus citreus TaxID=3367752 RepID=UPI0037AFDB8A
MFKKVLIVDDHDVVYEGIRVVLKKNAVLNVCTAQYCEEAILKIKKAFLDKVPFDLLIADLSFKTDYNNILSGENLIASIRIQYPNLKIIVYSMENRLQKVRDLINIHKVNAFVCKGRKGSYELEKALKCVYSKKLFLSSEVENAINPSTNFEIDDYDIKLIKQLSIGLSQGEISKQFKAQKIRPNSRSAIEKRLSILKDIFKANNTIHIVTIAKDLSLI